MTVEQDCLALAASSEVEVCGLILNDARLFPCRNVHPDPSTGFRISDQDWLDAYEDGDVTGVFHSHPGPLPVLSAADRRQHVAHELPWWLAQGGRLRKFRPVPHLLGRRFDHGVLDCFTLFRDAYHLCGIDIPDFERTNGWWLRHENLYIKNLAAVGFHQVDFAEAQPGDVLMIQAMKHADPCHAMILLDDGLVLHHDSGQLSRREPYRQAHIKNTHSVWRHRECSSFDLRGIYGDISARSL